MKSKHATKRLDILLVERGLAESLRKAQAMILAGEVQVGGTPAGKAGARVADDAAIEITSRVPKYASRGGIKLEGALEDFGIDVRGRACLDIGASAGGFTDCLLQHGAATVFAVDVNLKQMAWKLRQDARVVRIERNARELKREDIPELVDLVVADVSFISARKILKPAFEVATAPADFLILVKPQFELPPKDVGSGGIVSETALHEKAIASVSKTAAEMGLEIMSVRASHLLGAEGNQEYFLHARKKTME
jgi:23S rRNA (cytidine1920-2'-O)/16S rRNA (cytidine1409-2'-O)-methyltransferase